MTYIWGDVKCRRLAFRRQRVGLRPASGTEGGGATAPGPLVYVMHRCVAQPSEIIVFEVYKDEPAFEAHRRTPHIEELF